MKKYFHLALIIFSFLATSCGKQNSLFSSLGSKKKLKSEVNITVDSMDVAWNKMIEADDRKLADISRLLLEVSYTESYDESQHAETLQLLNKTKESRYAPSTMTDTEIDNYDLMTDKLIRETFSLAEQTPGIENHDIVPSLKDDILQEDGDVVIHRARYDEWAIKYNHLIENNERKLKKSGEPYNSLKKRHLFRLPY